MPPVIKHGKPLISANEPFQTYFFLSSLFIDKCNSSYVFQVTNVAETLGLGKKTPMGIFLDEFGIEPEVKYM